MLSGLEIPALSSMIKVKNSFSEVLGFDYLGSLVGTVIFAMVFYPFFGIVSSALFTGFLNLFVAMIFYLSERKKIGFYFGLVLFIIYIFVILNHSAIQENITRTYMSMFANKTLNYLIVKLNVIAHSYA